MTRIPAAMAGLALVAVTTVACGSDDGDDSTASDSSTSSAPASPSGSDSPSVSTSPSAAETTSPDPVPSPIVNKAVKPAIADGFPALIPAGVPAGWTVVSAAYEPKGGGVWTIAGLSMENGFGDFVDCFHHGAPGSNQSFGLLPADNGHDDILLYLHVDLALEAKRLHQPLQKLSHDGRLGLGIRR